MLKTHFRYEVWCCISSRNFFVVPVVDGVLYAGTGMYFIVIVIVYVFLYVIVYVFYCSIVVVL